MKISVIIPTFNRCLFLKKIGQCIQQQLLPPNISLEVIIVVDGSTDGTIEMLQNEFPNYHIILGNGNWWWTKCMNEGFKKASTLSVDFVLVLNDDTEIKPEYISTLWEDYQTLPKDSILGSASISIEPKDLIDSAGTKNLNFWLMKAIPYLPNLTPLFQEFKGVHPTWTMNGRGSLFPINIFEKIGMYDEKLLQYGSDDEFAIRARKFGLPVYISWNARVYNHLMMTSEGTAFRKDSFWKFVKSFFNPYSVNSIKKSSYIYWKHGIKVLIPIFIIFVFLGTTKAYFFKYRRMKSNKTIIP